MVELIIPDPITEPHLLAVFSQDFSGIGNDQIEEWDFEGRREWDDHRTRMALVHRLVAGAAYLQRRNYEDAGFSLNKAGSIALILKFPTTALECAKREVSLYEGMRDAESETNLRYAKRRRSKAQRALRGNTRAINPSDHRWFVYNGR